MCFVEVELDVFDQCLGCRGLPPLVVEPATERCRRVIRDLRVSRTAPMSNSVTRVFDKAHARHHCPRCWKRLGPEAADSGDEIGEINFRDPLPVSGGGALE